MSSPRDARPGARRRFHSVLFVLLGAGLTWASSRADWVTMQVADGLQPPRRESVIGATWAAELAPIALAMGAAVIALLVVRGVFHRLVGVLIAGLAAGIALSAARGLTGAPDVARVRQLAGLPVRAEITELTAVWWPPALAIVGAVAALAGAVYAIARPPREKAGAGRYQTPAARQDDAREVMRGEGKDGAISVGDATGIPLNERLMWDALDAGEDPTSGAQEGPENSTNRRGLG